MSTDDRRLQVTLDASRRAEIGRLEAERWRAEQENASARRELALRDRNGALLVSQHHPCADLGIDRVQLNTMLAYIHHGDKNRLWRELELEDSV